MHKVSGQVKYAYYQKHDKRNDIMNNKNCTICKVK